MVKLIKTKIKELDFYYREDDKFVGQKIAEGKYEEYETMLMERQLKKDFVAVDIGANIGYYTLLMAKYAKKVIAFEPDKNNFEILKKNVEVNGFKNVVLVNAAVGSKKGKIRFFENKDNYGDGRVYGDKESYEVEMVTVDDFVEKVDLIKIDTQGWEPEVILGAREIIERDRPVLFLEYWPEGYGKAGLNGEKMMRFLKKTYKNIWQIEDNLNIYRKVRGNILINKTTGYADLMVKNENSLSDYLNSFRNMKIKKMIKNLFFHE